MWWVAFRHIKGKNAFLKMNTPCKTEQSENNCPITPTESQCLPVANGNQIKFCIYYSFFIENCNNDYNLGMRLFIDGL